jgi:primosomal protein N' (replication factor Y) (superfamily II helicase)
MFFQVALNVPLFKTFEYFYLESKIINSTNLEGRRVLVSFSSKNIVGIIVKCSNVSSLPNNIKVKEIIELIDDIPLFTTEILNLLKWASEYYHYPIGEVCYSAIPSALRNDHNASLPIIEGWEKANFTDTNGDVLKGARVAKKAFEIICQGPISTLALREQGISKQILNKLQNLELIEKIDLRKSNTKWYEKQIKINKELQLNIEQKNIVNSINLSCFNVYLINGVTGSGKTEVYLHIIAKCLRKGLQALVLVPEINLTPQTVSRFYDRFSVPIVCIHSSLTNTEKLQSFLVTKSTEAAILIGTRSSLFTPMPKLGVIIVDEEHDYSYHQDDGFRYSARDCAIKRAQSINIPILLGSATPSIESINNVRVGKYIECRLNNRAGKASMVSSEIIDMRHQNVIQGLSEPLIDAIARTISQGNQALIMLNRRGYAQSVICHDCGFIFKCSNCDTNLCFHSIGNFLSCHHCETKYPIPQVCPKCGSSKLVSTGNGTEKICETLSSIFPNAHIIRIDRDTTSKKGILEEYLNNINSNKYQILVGTQMLAKGHHFPNVTLVGIVNIDSYLYSNDYRATEKLAQLIIQVSGRAGREEKTGHVILQTHCPKQPLLLKLINDGYDGFATECLKERYLSDLPPFSYQFALRADGTDKKDVFDFLDNSYKFLLNNNFLEKGTTFTPPFSSLIERRQNRFHMQIIVQSKIRKNISECATILLNKIDQFNKRNKIHTVIEIDPIDII